MHPTIRITHNSLSADIDEMIAPLIKLMWEADIETIESCQESYDGWAAIYFYGIEQPQKFLKIVYTPDQDALNFASTLGDNIRISLPFNKWKMEIIPSWKNGNISIILFHNQN